jgi:hypothetical protein
MSVANFEIELGKLLLELRGLDPDDYDCRDLRRIRDTFDKEINVLTAKCGPREL